MSKPQKAAANVQAGEKKNADRRPSISVCMMVKNEEKRLPTALASVKDWVDEIIVVDTGSTDKTVEIAESFAAKIFHHPWEYDFSKHRNQTLQYATGDWLFVLDADEELASESGPLLRQLATAPPEIHCFMFELYNSMAIGGDTFLLHPRLFRNWMGFHYEGKVHNRPMITGQVGKTTIKLIHHGYNEDAATMEVKHERRLLMIRKWVDDEPESFHARSYLAHTLQARPDTWGEAIEQALIGLELLAKFPLEQQRQFAPHLYYPLLNSMAALSRDDELLQHAAKCQELSPTFPDACFFTALVHFKRHNWQEVYQAGKQFLSLQEECRLHPEQFIYYENLTRGQLNNVRMRLIVACAQVGHEDEVPQIFADMYVGDDAEVFSKLTVQNLMAGGFAKLARELTDMAVKAMPQWPWPANMQFVVETKSKEEEAAKARERGQALLEAGKHAEAIGILEQAHKGAPTDDQIMLSLAKGCHALGNEDRAIHWLVGGINAHPGHPWAWLGLADYYFQHDHYLSAEACYKRYLQMGRSDEQIASRLEVCVQNNQQQVTVRQKPPKLLLIMVNSLSYQLVRQPAPHFLMGKAWGELIITGYEGQSDTMWATLMTGSNPMAHGLLRSDNWHDPLTLQDIKVKSMWEVLPDHITLGLAAVPLAVPPIGLPGWALPGYPTGILQPALVEPEALTGLALAHGYRSDYLLSQLSEQTLPIDINGNIVQEAFMLQMERNKLMTVMHMPAVDVLAVGFNFIEYQQRVHGLPQYNTFSVYQQFYGWLETTLAALQPENFAILSQRGLTMNPGEYRGGFYALSWLKGENGQAEVTDVAPTIINLLGGNPNLLGQTR